MMSSHTICTFSKGLSYQSSLLTLVKCIMSVDIDEDMEEFVGEVG